MAVRNDGTLELILDSSFKRIHQGNCGRPQIPGTVDSARLRGRNSAATCRRIGHCGLKTRTRSLTQSNSDRPIKHGDKSNGKSLHPLSAAAQNKIKISRILPEFPPPPPPHASFPPSLPPSHRISGNLQRIIDSFRIILNHNPSENRQR